MNKVVRITWSATQAAVALLFMCAAAVFCGCASAPQRGAPPTAPPPAAGRERVPPAPGSPAALRRGLPQIRVSALAAGRPVRVLLGDAHKDLSLQGESIRAWNAAGTPAANGSASVRLSAIGERIRWGSDKLLDSPVDVSSPGGLRVGGKQLVGRIRVSARKGLLYAVAVVPLEDYVAAVCGKEAPPSFHPEALSALAVAVRTYALIAMEKPRDPTHDVVAGVEDQVFEGMDGIAPAFRTAAESTRGEVLAYQGALARAVFHSTCGGRTENAKDAWGSDVPYLRSVACDDCSESPAYRWEYRMAAKEGKRIAQALGVHADEALRFAVMNRTSTGRANRVRISSNGATREVSAANFRRNAGYARVKSLKMEIAASGSGWTIAGEGYGHGVGMCQWGANGMAKRGKTYGEILARYYTGAYLAGGVP